MLDVTFGYTLFTWWVPCGMWPTDYLDWLSQLDDSEESSY
jgi:hypothetical protein